MDSELGPSKECFDLLAKLRSLRALAGPLTSTKHGNPAMLEQWRQDEVFDPGERVNTAHSPLACGDVFVRSDFPEVFVLLGQPCDIAVRPDGHRNTYEAIFAKAKKWNPEQAGQNGFIGSAHHFFPLPALPIRGTDQWRLDFRRWASVNLRLLDFSVFSDAGDVRLDLSVEPPVFLLPGWRKMFDRAKMRIRAQKELPAEVHSAVVFRGSETKNGIKGWRCSCALIHTRRPSSGALGGRRVCGIRKLPGSCSIRSRLRQGIPVGSSGAYRLVGAIRPGVHCGDADYAAPQHCSGIDSNGSSPGSGPGS